MPEKKERPRKVRKLVQGDVKTNVTTNGQGKKSKQKQQPAPIPPTGSTPGQGKKLRRKRYAERRSAARRKARDARAASKAAYMANGGVDEALLSLKHRISAEHWDVLKRKLEREKHNFPLDDTTSCETPEQASSSGSSSESLSETDSDISEDNVAEQESTSGSKSSTASTKSIAQRAGDKTSRRCSTSSSSEDSDDSITTTDTVSEVGRHSLPPRSVTATACKTKHVEMAGNRALERSSTPSSDSSVSSEHVEQRNSPIPSTDHKASYESSTSPHTALVNDNQPQHSRSQVRTSSTDPASASGSLQDTEMRGELPEQTSTFSSHTISNDFELQASTTGAKCRTTSEQASVAATDVASNSGKPQMQAHVLPSGGPSGQALATSSEAAPERDGFPSAEESSSDSSTPLDDTKPQHDPNSTTEQPLSKNQQKKLKRRQAWEENRAARKVKRKEKAQAKKERNRQAQNGEKLPAQIIGAVKHVTATQVPLTVILDCSFDDMMTDKERVSLSSQITRCYSDNRYAPYRVHLIVSSFNKGLKARFETVLCNNYRGWKGVRFTENDFGQAAREAQERMKDETDQGTVAGALSDQDTGDGDSNKGEIIYLTSDSPLTLKRLSPYSTYIIGGLVDRNRYKGICYGRAMESKVKTARLPISEHMEMASRSVLTTNQVMEIMLKWLEVGDWGEAFTKAIPKRKGGVMKTVIKAEQDEEL